MPEAGKYTLEINADAGQAVKILDSTGNEVLKLGRSARTATAGIDQLGDSTEDVSRGMGDASRQTKAAGDEVQKTARVATTASEKLHNLYLTVELVKTAYGSLTGVASAIGSVFGNLKGQVDEIGKTFREASFYAVDPAWLSEFSAVAKAAGKDMEDVLDVVRDVRERVGESIRELDVGNEANTFVVAFKELGATKEMIRAWGNDTAGAVDFVMQKMAETGKESSTLQMTLQELASAGTEKFGPILNALGPDGLAGALATVRAMGLSSNAAIGKLAEDASFKMGLLGQLGEGARKAFVVGLLPVLNELLNLAQEFVTQFGPEAMGGIEQFSKMLSESVVTVIESAVGVLYSTLELINDVGIWNAFTQTASDTWDLFTGYATAAIYTVAGLMVEVIGQAVEASLSGLASFFLIDTEGSQQIGKDFTAKGQSMREGLSSDTGLGQGQLGGALDALAQVGVKLAEVRESVENYTVAEEASTESVSQNTEAQLQNAEAKQFSAQYTAELSKTYSDQFKTTQQSLETLMAERDALIEAAEAGMTKEQALRHVELATIDATAAQMLLTGHTQEQVDAWKQQQLALRSTAQEIEKLNEGFEKSTQLGDSLQQGFTESFDAIINGTRDLKDIWKGVGLSMAKQLTNSFFGEMKGFTSGFKDLFSGLGSWVSNMFGNLFDGLGDSIGGWISDTFSGSGGGGGGGGFLSGVGGFLGDIGSGIMDIFSGDGGFLDGLGNWFMGENGVLSSIGDGIADFAGNALGYLADFGANLLTNVVQGGLGAVASIGLSMLPEGAREGLNYLTSAGGAVGALPSIAAGGINLIPGANAMVSPTGGVVYQFAGGEAGYIAGNQMVGQVVAGVTDFVGGFAFGALGGGLISRAMYPDNPQAQMGGAIGGGVASGATALALGGGYGAAGVGAAMGFGAVGSGASTLSGIAAFGGGAAALVGIGVAVGMMVASIVDAFRHFKTFDGTMNEVTTDILKATDAYDKLNQSLEESGLVNAAGDPYKVDPFGGAKTSVSATGQRFSGYGHFMSAAAFLANPDLDDSRRNRGYNWDNRFGERRSDRENAIVAAEGMADRLAANLANIEAQLIEQGMDVEQAAQVAMGIAKDHLDEWGVTLPGLMALMDPVLFMAQNQPTNPNAYLDVTDSVDFIQEMFGDQMPTGLDARMIYQAGLVPFGPPQKLTEFGSTGNVIGTGPNYGSGGTGGLSGLDMDPQQVAELNWLLGSGASMDEIGAYFAEKYPGNPLNLGSNNFAGTNQPFAAPGPNDFAAAGLYKELGESDEAFNARVQESLEDWEMFDAERAAKFVRRWAASAEMVQGNFYKIWGNPDTSAGIDEFIDSAFEATLKSQFDLIQGQIVDELFNDTIIAGAMLPVTTLLDEMNEMEIDWLDPEQAEHWTEILGTTFEEARANMEAMAPAIEEAKERAEQLSYIFMTDMELASAMVAKHGQDAVDRYFVTLLASEAVTANGIDAVMELLAAWQAAADEQSAAKDQFVRDMEAFASAIENQAVNAAGSVSQAISQSIVDGTYDGVNTLGGVADSLRDNLAASVVAGIVEGFIAAAGLKGDIENAVLGISQLGADGFTPDELFWIETMILGPLKAKVEGLDAVIQESGILELFGPSGGGSTPRPTTPYTPSAPGSTRTTGTGTLTEFEQGLGLGISGFGPSVGLSVMSWESSAQKADRERERERQRRSDERWQRRIGDLTTTLEDTPNHIEVKVDGDTLLTATTRSDRLATKGNRAGGR